MAEGRQIVVMIQRGKKSLRNRRVEGGEETISACRSVSIGDLSNTERVLVGLDIRERVAA